MDTRRVLVFGASNVGKTSMLNELTDNNFPVNNSARGCTFETVETPLVQKDGINYQFLDTAGLNETDKGTVKSKDAVQNIIKLLKHSKDGINLLIYIMRIGTISQAEKDNYNMFCNIVTDRKVPVICVITGCENEEPMSQWVTDNRHIFESNEMIFSAMVATCFAKGGRFESQYSPLRQESARYVWNAITAHAAKQPIDFVQRSGGLAATFRRIWNVYCKWLGKLTWLWVNGRVRDILIGLGFASDEAAEIAEHF